jgi:eukaryotic-like serine/threonine-protein kinase
MPIEPGTLLGPYQVLRALGAGGMGEVFLARDTRLDREVAIKVLGPRAFEDPAARGRFRQEALALSRLSHPNIETVYDFRSAAGTDFLVLEFVPGETLAARLQRGPIPEREAAELGAQIADALEEAHERGVLHRDLKPANVIVTPKGRVKVLDFGLAKLLQAPEDESQTLGLTVAGSTLGTIPYMSPEQLLGEPVDARTDLYALGVLLYEMMSGRRPFAAPLSTALTNEILHGRVAPPRELVPTLTPLAERVVLRSLDRDRGRRYQTAAELGGELRRLVTPQPIENAALAVPATSRITSIIVLPLENLSGDPDQEFFVDGMTEELIACLAQVRALRIISRTTAMRYKGLRKPLAEIASELNVDAVVEGSVRRAGDRVRITAQLIDAATDRHLWAKSYERDLREVLTLQGEVAQAIVEEIQVTVTPGEESRLRGSRTVHPEAYEACLKGRYMIERRTEASLRGGLAHFEAAVRLDPTFGLAHVGMADAYNLMGFYSILAPGEAFPRAKTAALRALEINPASAEAHTSLAYSTLYHAWDLPEARRQFRRAIDINPKYSTAHLWYANLLFISDGYEESLAEFRLSRNLDPLSMPANTSFGWLAYYYRRYEEACVQLHKAIGLLPDFLMAHYWLGLTFVQLGRHAEALAEFERSVATAGRYPMTITGLALAHAAAGREDAARSLLGELDSLPPETYVSSYFRAQILGALGDRAAGLTALEHALEERAHELIAIGLDPSLDPLRGEPRFAAVERRIRR